LTTALMCKELKPRVLVAVRKCLVRSQRPRFRSQTGGRPLRPAVAVDHVPLGLQRHPAKQCLALLRLRCHRRQHQHLQGSARPVATRACSGRLHGDAGYDGCTPGQRPGQRAQLFRRLRQPPGTQVERRDAFVSGRVERASNITAQPCHGFRGSCGTNGLASARHACMNALL